MFVASYLFRAEVPKASLLAFISHAPSAYYMFIVPEQGAYIYGCLLTDELVEYFTNEFPVRSFVIIEATEMKEKMRQAGCKIWGNPELLPA